VLKEVGSEIAVDNQKEDLTLSWRVARYYRFYEIVDQIVHQLQEHVWDKTGKPKRRERLKGYVRWLRIMVLAP
jgi:hypothetical protein